MRHARNNKLRSAPANKSYTRATGETDGTSVGVAPVAGRHRRKSKRAHTRQHRTRASTPTAEKAQKKSKKTESETESESESETELKTESRTVFAMKFLFAKDFHKFLRYQLGGKDVLPKIKV